MVWYTRKGSKKEKKAGARLPKQLERCEQFSSISLQNEQNKYQELRFELLIGPNQLDVDTCPVFLLEKNPIPKLSFASYAGMCTNCFYLGFFLKKIWPDGTLSSCHVSNSD